MDEQYLAGLDGLAELGARSGVDMRPTLLRVLTDLYMQKLKHTPEEERHYTELALRLLDSVDVPTRLAVASRLVRHLAPPLRVLQYLAGDRPDVAAVLQPHSVPPSPAQSTKPSPDEALAPIIEDRPEDEERPPAAAVARLIDTTTAQQLNAMFFAADSTERRLILLNLEIAAPLPAGHVGVLRDPSVGERLEAAAFARRREDFAQHLARALQIPRAQAQRILRDDLGETLVVAGKALGMPRDRLYRILMFANPSVGHSVERVHALTALYDEMTTPAAEGMVAIWQALEKREHPGATYRQPTRPHDTRLGARPVASLRQPATTRTNERRDVS